MNRLCLDPEIRLGKRYDLFASEEKVPCRLNLDFTNLSVTLSDLVFVRRCFHPKIQRTEMVVDPLIGHCYSDQYLSP